jgi:hypothetical protein
MESMSLSAFATRMHVTPQAVSAAVRRRRLKRSIAHDASGRPFISDFAVASLEWQENRSRLAPLASPVGTSAPAPVPTSALEEVPPAAADPVASPSLVDAQTAAMIERARKFRMENDLREGLLLEVGQAARAAFEFARVLREAVLNVPARVSAELAAETDATRVHLRLERALREALEATASVLEAATPAPAAAGGDAA